MHDYQRTRVMMLLDPEIDPLGAAGYHIIQSKIAIGSEEWITWQRLVTRDSVST